MSMFPCIPEFPQNWGLFKDPVADKLKTFQLMRERAVALQGSIVPSEYEKRDIVLLRYLRLNKFDLEASYSKWLLWIEWRHDLKCEEITADDVRHETESGICVWRGMDKARRHCCVMTGRLHDPVERRGNYQSMKKFMISLVEDGVKLAETREERAYYAMQNGVTGSAILDSSVEIPEGVDIGTLICELDEKHDSIVRETNQKISSISSARDVVTIPGMSRNDAPDNLTKMDSLLSPPLPDYHQLSASNTSTTSGEGLHVPSYRRDYYTSATDSNSDGVDDSATRPATTTSSASDVGTGANLTLHPDMTIHPEGQQLCILYDRRGLDWHHIDPVLFQLCRQIFQDLQSQYAAKLGVIYILHANWFYWILFQYIIKPFLDLVPLGSQIIVVNSTEDLLQYFEEDQLLLASYDEEEDCEIAGDTSSAENDDASAGAPDTSTTTVETNEPTANAAPPK